MKLIKNTLSNLISIVLAFLLIGFVLGPTFKKIAPPNPAAQESSDRFICALGITPRDITCVQDLYADLLIRFDALKAEHNQLLQQTTSQPPELGP